MRKTLALIVFIILVALVGGCGQADFANIKVTSSRVELDETDNSYLVLSMEIENLTDGVLYIESSSPTNEEGEKHLWFVVMDQDGNEYKATYYSEIESSIFPMSVSPLTTTIGEMAFELPSKLQGVTLEVKQNVVGEKGSKIINTKDIPI